MKKLLLVAFLPVFSCEKPFCNEKPSDEIAGIVIEIVGDRTYLAYDPERCEDPARFGLHIATDQQDRQVFTHCCAAKLDGVDFTQYDRLGLTTVNNGLHSAYLREAHLDEGRKK